MHQRFLFLRHGHYTKDGLSAAQRDRASLSAEGQAQARDAAVFVRRWLEVGGLRLGRVVATNKQRTQETARLVTEGLPLAPGCWHIESGGRGFAALMAKVERWLEPVGDLGVVLFVGSGSNLGHLCKALGPDPRRLTRHHAPVLVYQRSGEGWTLEQAYPLSG